MLNLKIIWLASIYILVNLHCIIKRSTKNSIITIKVLIRIVVYDLDVELNFIVCVAAFYS